MKGNVSLKTGKPVPIYIKVLLLLYYYGDTGVSLWCPFESLSPSGQKGTVKGQGGVPFIPKWYQWVTPHRDIGTLIIDMPHE
jgi:hypothetical protein